MKDKKLRPIITISAYGPLPRTYYFIFTSEITHIERIMRVNARSAADAMFCAKASYGGANWRVISPDDLIITEHDNARLK